MYLFWCLLALLTQVGHMKVCSAGVSEALLSVQQRRSALVSVHLPRRTPEGEEVGATVDSVRLSQGGASRLAADWASLMLSWAPPGASASYAYPLAQAHLNLRAAWLQWVLHRTALPGREEPAIALDLHSSGDLPAGQEDVLRWLERWTHKRRVSLSRSSTQSRSRRTSSSLRSSSQRSSLSRGSTPSTASKASGQRQGGRGRRRGRGSSDDSSSESEEEWSDGSEESEDAGEDDLEDSDSDGDAGPARRESSNAGRAAGGMAALSAVGDEEVEALSNVLVLEGPSGSGKSAAVLACARRLGYRVIEVNASQTRSGAAVRKTIAEAAQSAHILDSSTGASSASAETSLILFDEVRAVPNALLWCWDQN